MKQLYHLTLRHTVLFFKDKGRFLTALITPIVLIVLYMTFLGTVYHDSLDSIVKYYSVSQKTIDAFVNGYLFSSLLAVSCVTVSFCSNMIMVQDKADHKIKDCFTCMFYCIRYKSLCLTSKRYIILFARYLFTYFVWCFFIIYY